MRSPRILWARYASLDGDGTRLEPQVTTETGRDFPDKPLELELPDEEVCGLLVLPDLSQRDGTRPEPVLLLRALGVDDWGDFAGSLGTEGLPRGLATGGLPSGLLRARFAQTHASALKYCEFIFITYTCQTRMRRRRCIVDLV